jgi:hypothetical protein
MRGGDGSDPPSLEYIEDSYLPKIDQPTFTPSLDEITEYDQRFGTCDDLDLNHYNVDDSSWSEEQEFYLRSLTLDQLLSFPPEMSTHTLLHDLDEEEELQQIETEFSPMQQLGNNSSNNSKLPFRLSRRLKFFTRKAMREVRVTFVDLSKPYLAKMSSGDNYRKFLETGNNGYVIGNFIIQCYVIGS